MARAGDTDLDRIEDILAALRTLLGVRETKRGVFDRGRSAYVHFRADDCIVLADAKLHPGQGLKRFSLQTKADRAAFVSALPGP